MTAEGISTWIHQLRAGNHDAAERLWEHYFARLVGLARKKLAGVPRQAADEEDIALSAFDSFCRGVEQGRFPRVADADNVWSVLVLITARKAIDLREHENRQKRGGGQVFGESTLLAEGAAGLDLLVGHEPTPEFAAQVAEECQRLLAKLTKPELRSIALWKMEGYTNAEIAVRLGCAEVTVERRLALIRSLWCDEELRSPGDS
jgi:DNA-directed RNA polymerase specialized sigma24 family protein